MTEKSNKDSSLINIILSHEESLFTEKRKGAEIAPLVCLSVTQLLLWKYFGVTSECGAPHFKRAPFSPHKYGI